MLPDVQQCVIVIPEAVKKMAFVRGIREAEIEAAVRGAEHLLGQGADRYIFASAPSNGHRIIVEAKQDGQGLTVYDVHKMPVR